ncbi:hypothetical protein KSC_035180 [Ktedonobacter sp. SOSP1-52]|nr:hypothetical protein KSC_035180 [Ktedonobacter sp. SOSP1-52]
MIACEQRMEQCIERPGTCSNNQTEERAEKHTHINARFMGHLPKSVLQEERDFGCGDSNQHIKD